MGCDIHMAVEQRWSEETEWEPLVLDANIGRSYQLFSRLANVRWRDGFDPIIEPRGLPVDLSPAVQAWATEWGIDGHSHAWLIPAEAEKARGISIEMDGLLDFVASQKHYRTHRLVFWFDN